MLSYTYLARSQQINEFGEEDLAAYRYIAVFGSGSYANKITKHEFTMMCVELIRFMKQDCLIVIASELEDASDRSILKEIYQDFDIPINLDAYIAIGTIIADEDLFITPIYREIDWRSNPRARYPLLRALNQNLRVLRAKLTDATLDQFPFPPLPSGAQPLQFANGSHITNELDEKSIVLRDSGSVTCPETGQRLSAHRHTIAKARNGDLVLPSTLKYLSCLLKIPETELKFNRIVPNPSAVATARKLLAKEARKGLREWFGPFSDFFFDQIETAEDVPARCLKFIYHHYKKLIEDNEKKGTPLKEAIEPEELIDTNKTYALAVRLRSQETS